LCPFLHLYVSRVFSPANPFRLLEPVPGFDCPSFFPHNRFWGWGSPWDPHFAGVVFFFLFFFSPALRPKCTFFPVRVPAMPSQLLPFFFSLRHFRPIPLCCLHVLSFFSFSPAVLLRYPAPSLPPFAHAIARTYLHCVLRGITRRPPPPVLPSCPYFSLFVHPPPIASFLFLLAPSLLFSKRLFFPRVLYPPVRYNHMEPPCPPFFTPLFVPRFPTGTPPLQVRFLLDFQ